MSDLFLHQIYIFKFRLKFKIDLTERHILNDTLPIYTELRLRDNEVQKSRVGCITTRAWYTAHNQLTQLIQQPLVHGKWNC